MTYNHGRPHAWPWREVFVAQMLTRDLFAVANLMVLYRRCVAYTDTAVDSRHVPVTTPPTGSYA